MKRIIILVFFAFLSPAVFSHDLSGVWYHDQQLPEDYNEMRGYISSYSDDSPNIVQIVPRKSYGFDFERENETFAGIIRDHGNIWHFEVSELITVSENIFIIKFVRYKLQTVSSLHTKKEYDYSLVYEAKITFLDKNKKMIKIENTEQANFYLNEGIYYKIGEINQSFGFLSVKTVGINTYLWVYSGPDWRTGLWRNIEKDTKVYVIKFGPVVEYYRNKAAPMALVYIENSVIGWVFSGYFLD
jgi:hypothetical protein